MSRSYPQFEYYFQSEIKQLHLATALMRHTAASRKASSTALIIQPKNSLRLFFGPAQRRTIRPAGVRANARISRPQAVRPTTPHRRRGHHEALDDISPHVKPGSIGNDEANAVFIEASLLCRHSDDGSPNKAAKNMGMAYSKAWRIMKQNREAFGFNPHQSRRMRTRSTLTKEGTLPFRIRAT